MASKARWRPGMLRKIRDWYKIFGLFDLAIEFARLIAIVLVGVVTMAVFASRRQLDEAAPIVAQVLGALAVLSLALWIYRDARKVIRTIAQQKQCRNMRDADSEAFGM